MSASKSPDSTVLARRNRVIELLAEGKTDAEAAEILRQEGFPASVPTVWRDMQALKPEIAKAMGMTVQEATASILEELQDLRVMLTDISFNKKEQFEGLMAILDRKIRLLIPTKAVVGHVKGPQLDSLYLDIRQILLDETDAVKKAALEVLRGFVKKQHSAPQLEAGNADLQ